jgi:hypothetical protein
MTTVSPLALSHRSGGIISRNVGFPFSETFYGRIFARNDFRNIGGYTGSANEYTIWNDFNHERYLERFRSDYKFDISYCRKTMSGSVGKSSQNPKQMHRKQKKLAGLTDPKGDIRT